MTKFTKQTLIPVLGLFLAASLGCDSKPEPAKEKTAAKPTTPAASADQADEPADPADQAPQDDEVPELDETVITAAKVANNLEKSPTEVDKILGEANLDAEQFDEMMYEIASDPELTDQYRLARSMNLEE